MGNLRVTQEDVCTEILEPANGYTGRCMYRDLIEPANGYTGRCMYRDLIEPANGYTGRCMYRDLIEPANGTLRLPTCIMKKNLGNMGYFS